MELARKGAYTRPFTYIPRHSANPGGSYPLNHWNLIQASIDVGGLLPWLLQCRGSTQASGVASGTQTANVRVRGGAFGTGSSSNSANIASTTLLPVRAIYEDSCTCFAMGVQAGSQYILACI